MSAKDKAIELVNRFGKIELGECENGKPYLMAQDSLREAKQCALICVDEILKSHYKLLGGVNTTIYKHYQEVKQEIKNYKNGKENNIST
jgi:predicted proteasome-type protease